MIRHATRAALVAGAALFLAAPAARAQWSPSLVVKAGATLPVGDFGDAVKTGYNVGVGGEFTQALSPLGFRLEAEFHENEFEDQYQLVRNEKFRTLAGTANLLYSQSKVSGPYVIGGVGVYRGYVPDSNEDGETKFGLNGGIGFRFGLTGFSTFVEARYHHIMTEGSATQMIPISFGVKF